MSAPPLEELDLPLDVLTPSEMQALTEVMEAAEEGFSRYSKQGKSLKDYWGKDYQRKAKTFERAKSKLAKTLPDVKRQ